MGLIAASPRNIMLEQFSARGHLLSTDVYVHYLLNVQIFYLQFWQSASPSKYENG